VPLKAVVSILVYHTHVVRNHWKKTEVHVKSGLITWCPK